MQWQFTNKLLYYEIVFAFSEIEWRCYALAQDLSMWRNEELQRFILTGARQRCSEVSVRPLSYPGAPESYELVLVAYERYLFIQIDLDLKSISKIFPFLQTDSSAYLKPNKLSQLFTNRIFFWDKIYSNFKFCFLFGRKRLKRKLTIDWLTCRSLIIFLK